MAKRKAISKKTRFEVFKRDKFTCQYCGESAPDVILHVDHIIPVARGGDGELINLITSCEGCNVGKGARQLTDTAALTKQRDQLKEIEERRQQIEMMAKWREELRGHSDRVVDLICEEIGRSIDYSFGISEAGKRSIRLYSKKYKLDVIFQAIDSAAGSYLRLRDGKYTNESVEKFLGMIPRLAEHISCGIEPHIGAQSAYITGILFNRFKPNFYPKKGDMADARQEIIDLLKKGCDFGLAKNKFSDVESWKDYDRVYEDLWRGC